MAIYAQRTAFRSSAYIPDIKIIGSSPNNKDILIWSDNEQAFISGNISSILPPGIVGTGNGTIVNGINLGSGAQIFSALSAAGTNMDFRSITGNNGISVIQDGAVLNEINITNDIITQAKISVPDSFKIIIDNDNTTINSAKFEIFSNVSVGKITLIPVVFTAPNLDIEIIADPNLINKGQIKTSSGDFITLGFEPGMCLSIFGTINQDGIWTIDSVTTNIITITIPFPNATNAGFQPITVLKGLHFNIINNQTIQITGSDLPTLGFASGQQFTITNSTNNDGIYTINTVILDTIIINEILPGTIGCDVNSIVIATTPITLTSGWYVNELGEMQANNTNIAGTLTVSNDIIIQGQPLTSFINSAIIHIPDNGIVTQTAPGIFVGRELIGNTGITVSNGNGILGNPTIIANDFTISLGNELSGSVTILGLGSSTLNASLANLPQFAGLSGNTYNRVTIDGAGRVSFGENQNIIGVNGIIVTNGNGILAQPAIGANNFKLTFNGDVFGTGIVAGLNDVAINLSLPDLIIANTFNNVTVDTKGRVISGFTDPLNFQPANIRLDTLSNGMINSGFVIWDGTTYINRLLDGTINQIIINNNNGQISNPTIGLSDNVIIPGVESITIPLGGTLQRPVTATDGMIRFDTDTISYDVYKNGSWKTLAITGEITGFLPTVGGIMTGDIIMNSNNIIFTSGLVDGRNISIDGNILDNINSGTGIKVQIAPDVFINRTLIATVGKGLYVINGAGLANNPSVGLDLSNIPNGNLEPNYVNDTMVYYNTNTGQTTSTTVGKINRRQAFSYFMAQI